MLVIKTKKTIKALIIGAALSVLSVGGGILINVAIAAWTGPSADPPSGNAENLIFENPIFIEEGTNYVGIGTSNPNKHLHIKTSSGNAELDIQSGSSQHWGIYQDDSTNDLRFWSGDNRVTFTDGGYVGIGTASPNKHLHIKTSSGNAELDIQSGSQNHWALYHDNSTEQLRFWNNDFSGDIGPGVGNVLVIGNDGTVLAKTPADGDSDNAVSTKGYVDAAVSAAGGGDATLANQEDMMGGAFSADTDSLEAISRNIDTVIETQQDANILGDTATIKNKIGEIADATGSIMGESSTLFSAIKFIWENRFSFLGVTSGSTYFSVGGDPYYCKKITVDSNGKATVTSINNDNTCGSGKICAGGQCGSETYLTWSGSSHTNLDCGNAGGTVYATDSGTMCKFSGTNVSCPNGWNQASSWQRYASSEWGGDGLGHYKSTGPTTFINEASTCYRADNCDPLDRCNTSGDWYCYRDYYNCRNTPTWSEVLSSSNCNNNRVEVGCY